MLSEELEKRGHEILHFSMRHPRNRPSPFSDFFVERRDYGSEPGSSAGWLQAFSFIRSRRAAANMKCLVDEYKPDVAHLHNIYHQITPSIIPVLRKAGVAVVMTLHDYKLICPNYTLFADGRFCFKCRGGKFHRASFSRCREGSWKKSTLLALEAYWQGWTKVYDSVDYFISPSRYLRERFIEAGFEEERVLHVPPCVPVVGGEEEGSSEPAAFLPDKYVMYFGRLSPEKGLLNLITAVGMSGVELVVCGEGPQESELKRRAANIGKVHFLGYREQAELRKIIRRARAVVLPSIWAENAPFTVLEAAACGVPVVVSDMGGLPEMAEKLGGMVFKHDSVDDLASRLREVWENDVVARAGSVAVEGIARYYDVETHIGRLEEIYARAIERVGG